VLVTQRVRALEAEFGTYLNAWSLTLGDDRQRLPVTLLGKLEANETPTAVSEVASRKGPA
jgi:hypothetical protein